MRIPLRPREVIRRRRASTRAPALDGPTSTDPTDPTDAEATLRRRHAGARVLLAEDNELGREIVTELLLALGLAVDAAVDGRQAVRLAGERRFELVLMDIRMPEMDGLAASRLIRALPGGATTPIVALTANASDDDRLAYAAAGMDDVVAKPIDLPQFHAALLRWLPGRGAAPVPAASSRAACGDEGAALAALAALPGFDIAQGLGAVLGNATKYIALMRRLIDSADEQMRGLAASLAAGDIETAQLRAHSLRGAAATLGATDLAAHAWALEATLGVEPQPDSAAPLLAAIARAFAALAAALPAVAAPAAGAAAALASPEAPALADLRAQLDAMLAQCDSAAIDLFRAHGARLRAAHGTQAEALGSLIENFEFDDARALLRALG